MKVICIKNQYIDRPNAASDMTTLEVGKIYEVSPIISDSHNSPEFFLYDEEGYWRTYPCEMFVARDLE